MTLSEITVTMSLSEYERMKNQIQDLRAKSIENFIEVDYKDTDAYMNDEFTLKYNHEEIHKYFAGEEEGIT